MVTVAETAKLALDALGALAGRSDDVLHPDLILLDMQLPDSTGLDVLRSIRKDERLLRPAPVRQPLAGGVCGAVQSRQLSREVRLTR